MCRHRQIHPKAIHWTQIKQTSNELLLIVKTFYEDSIVLMGKELLRAKKEHGAFTKGNNKTRRKQLNSFDSQAF